MTPADLTMKRALDEGAAFGRLPSMAGVGNPLLYPDSNSTPFTLRSKDSLESTGSSYYASFTPRLTLRQFRQFQLSPVLSSPPAPDYKRVRRKKSLIQLNTTSLGFASSSPQTTSSLPSSYTTSLQNFLPSPQPPTYLTPVPRSRTRAPSLSSTVDTLQSTPLRTPIQQGSSDLEQWREFERSKLPEPLRTKRKFPLFKQAKRLPHSNDLGGGGGSGKGEVWEVHAVVVDSGGFVSVGSSDALERSGTNVPQSVGKKGRSVRFKGIDENISREQSRGLASLRSGEEKESSLSSSFSLSKFTFPEPPGQRLGGTFEQHSEPTSPASPATLHYRGASFDVVNPHESLLLGSSEIETPAEIDGLLDDYFGSRSTLSEMQPYDNFTGEMQTSQTSLPTNSSNGRQRILYDDADSARRRIMGIEAENGPRANDNGPYQQSPLANRGRGRWLEGSALWPQSHPGMMWHGFDGQDERDDEPGPEQMQHHLAQAVHRSAATRLYDRNDGFENVPITEAHDARDVYDDENEEDSPEGGDEDAARDRGSSLYPYSQRSDPFDLTVSDLDDNESHFNKIDEVMSRNWLPPYTGRNAGAYNPDIDPIHEDEDVADAQATQNPYEAETTIGEIVSHYNYERPPLHPRYDDEEADLEPSSGSLEDHRGFTGRYDIFGGQSSSPHYNAPPSSYDISARSARSQHRSEIFDLHRRATARIHGPPRMPAPTPPQSVIESRARQVPHQYSDLPTTDQTYGSTGQLLNLTPHQQLQLTGDLQQRTDPHSDLYRIGSHGNWSSRPPNRFQQYTEDEDKENAPPVPRVPPMPSGLTVPTALQRSSSIYSENDGDWQTERSESHPYLVDASGGVHTGALRRSEESHANTSSYTLDPRFSYPTQPVPGVAGFQQTHQPIVGMHDNVPRVFEPEGTISGREKGKQPVRSTSHGDKPGDENVESADKETSPAAIKRAVKFVSDKIGGLKITPPKPAYSPTINANRALQLGAISEAHQSASSDRQGLLQHTGMPFASPGLRWNDTNHTFLTSPRTPVGPTMPYSPLGSMPYNQTPITPPSTAMVLRNRAATELSMNPRHGTPTTRDIELQRLRGHKPRRVSRAAMSSQTELRPLELADSVTGALTAAELEEAERHWTDEPQRNALARLVEDQNGFAIVQNDGTVERVNALMRPNEARLISFRREQRLRTAPYFHACVLCPITSLIFGLGGLDWRMKQITKGRIAEMSPSAKKQALQVYTMLSLIAWMFLGIVIAILIVAID